MTLAKQQTQITGILINNNKTANIKDKNLKVTTTCKVDGTYITQ